MTTSSYTKDEDFSQADAVVSELGDSGSEAVSLDTLTLQGLAGLKGASQH